MFNVVSRFLFMLHSAVHCIYLIMLLSMNKISSSSSLSSHTNHNLRPNNSFNHIFIKSMNGPPLIIFINTDKTTTTLFTLEPAEYGTTITKVKQLNTTNNKTSKTSWNYSRPKTNIFTTQNLPLIKAKRSS